MKSKNQRTAGNAMSWALGVTLGVIVGLALLIAIPRMMFPPAATGADAPQAPAATASTNDSSGAATNAEAGGTEGTSTEMSSEEGNTQTAAATTETAEGEANAEAGKAVYAGSCAGCHGAEGQGAVGPALNAAADWSDAEFTTALREGKTPEKELAPIMPRFAEAQLSAQQVNDVHAFIKTLY